MRLCGADPCKRAAAAERSRKAREKAKADPVKPVRRPRATKITPDMPSTFGPVVSPWGKRYDTVQHMHGDVLLSGGLDGTVTPEDQDRWSGMLSELGL